MDRNEAVLRELNLYPVWVRREPVVGQGGVLTEAPVSEAPVDTAPFGTAPVDAADPAAADLFSAAPAATVDASDSLREFQIKNQGGAYAALSLPELEQKVEACELCGLCKGRTQTVFGTGSEHAEWMFIGEAPGADEDASGEPFTGHAGRLLDNMLLAIGLKRQDVYIANVIKCRPPEDRTPHVAEISSCMPYLRRQIDRVAPRIIVALGKTAACAVLETDQPVGSLRGVVHDYKGIPLIATFHPAYLLRSPMEKARAWQDLRLAVETMRSAAR